MKEIIMNASWLAAIILCVVGIIKLPFSGFKAKYKKLFRATFFMISLALIAGGSVFAQLYIIEQPLLEWSFAWFTLTTAAGVFGGYSAYENVGLKALVKTIIQNLKNFMSNYSDSKVAKMIDKVGMEKIEAIAKLIPETKTEIVIEQDPNAKTTEETVAENK